MSKSGLKAKAKAERKEKALKKAFLKRIVIFGILALVVTTAVVFTVQKLSHHEEEEIYSAGGQTVRLSENGKFSANLAHGVRKSGTYTREIEDGRTTIYFNVEGREEIGWIFSDALHMPREWDDGHGHGSILPKADLSPSRDRHHGHSH